jgi:hypothetical protein
MILLSGASSYIGGCAAHSTCSWGGRGLRRGRRDPVGIQVGDTIDFWRVERFEQDRLLALFGFGRSTATSSPECCNGSR